MDEVKINFCYIFLDFWRKCLKLIRASEEHHSKILKEKWDGGGELGEGRKS